MPLTDSAILEELIHAMYRIEPQLGPRARATLLVAKERLGLEDVSRFLIEIEAFVSDEPGETKIVTVHEYANSLERVLSNDGSGCEVLRVIPPNQVDETDKFVTPELLSNKIISTP